MSAFFSKVLDKHDHMLKTKDKFNQSGNLHQIQPTRKTLSKCRVTASVFSAAISGREERLYIS